MPNVADFIQCEKQSLVLYHTHVYKMGSQEKRDMNKLYHDEVICSQR